MLSGTGDPVSYKCGTVFFKARVDAAVGNAATAGASQSYLSCGMGRRGRTG